MSEEIEKEGLEAFKFVKKQELEKFRLKWITGFVTVLVALISSSAAISVGIMEYFSKESELELQRLTIERENSIKSAEQQRIFLHTFAERVMNGDLNYRRDFAHYVSTVSTDQPTKNAWNAYLSDIEGEISVKRQALAKRQEDLTQSSNTAEIARIYREIERIERLLEGGTDIRSTPSQQQSAEQVQLFEEFVNSLDLKSVNPSDLYDPKNLVGTLPPPEFWNNVREILITFEEISRRIGQSLKIHALYRSPSYNESISGARQSLHLTAQAMDISSEGMSGFELARRLLELQDEGVFLGGVGGYAAFAHFDIRGETTAWGQIGSSIVRPDPTSD